MIQLITRLIPVKKPRFLLNMKTILVSRIYNCENDMLMNMNEEDLASYKVGDVLDIMYVTYVYPFVFNIKTRWIVIQGSLMGK